MREVHDAANRLDPSQPDVTGGPSHSRKRLEGALDLPPGARLWVGGHDVEARREIEQYLADTVRPGSGPLDAAVLTPNTADEAAYFAAKLKPRLELGARILVTVPRNDATTPRGEGESLSAIVSAIEAAGLQRTEERSVSSGRLCIEFSLRPL